MFGVRLYIQISAGQLQVSSPSLEQTYTAPPLIALSKSQQKQAVAFGHAAQALIDHDAIHIAQPFSHPRLVLSDIAMGEQLLRHAFNTVMPRRWPPVIRLGIVHPQRNFATSLTPMEYQALNEVCLAAGCRKAAIHEGAALTMQAIQTYALP